MTERITWLAGIALLGIILGLLLAPLFEARLNRAVVNSIVAAALFIIMALLLGIVAGAAQVSAMRLPVRDERAEVLAGSLAIFGGISMGIGFFLLVWGCSRFALSQTRELPAGAPRNPAPP